MKSLISVSTILKVFILSFNAVLLIGCASTPVSTSEAVSVPNNRILADGKQFIAPSKNTGKIIVKRDSGFIGSACTVRIYLNGKGVADLDVSEKMVLNLTEGEYIVSAEPNGVCGGGLTEVKASVKPNSESVFRYGTSSNFSSSLYPTAF